MSQETKNNIFEPDSKEAATKTLRYIEAYRIQANSISSEELTELRELED